MSVLSDKDIQEYMNRKEDPLVIQPLNEWMWTPNGIDLRLSNTFQIAKAKNSRSSIDVLEANIEYEKHEVPKGQPIEINIGEHLIFKTLETVKLPRDLTGQLMPRTKYLRMGLGVNSPGAVEAGYDGPLVIDVFNYGLNPKLIIYPYLRIAQLLLHQLKSPCEYDYQQRSGKYTCQNTLALPDSDLERKLIKNGELQGIIDHKPEMPKH